MIRLLVVSTCALLSAFGQDSAAQKIAKQHYEELIQNGTLTGAAFAEVNGSGAFTAVFGNAQPDSLWRAASTSKALTAVAVLRLVESGRLDLNVNVNRYLKTFQIPSTKRGVITLRHLLTHTSGLDDPFVNSAFLTGKQPPLARVIRDHLPKRLYEPDETRLYSNFGYGILGALIEDVTGRSYNDFMQGEVLRPLGMRDSTFQQPLPDAMRRRVVPCQERTALGLVRPAEILYHRATAGGGLTTTIGDLVGFARFVQASGSVDGRPVLRPETLRQMLGGTSEPGGDSESYGFGSGTNRGERYWYAGGDLGGYHTVILWFPEHEKALITLAASPNVMATWGLVPKIMEVWFGPPKVSVRAVPVTPVPHAREWATRVAGIYRPVRYPHSDIAKTFVITMDRSVQVNPDASLNYGGDKWIAVAPLRFRHVSEERYLTFQEDSNGHIRFLNRDAERIAWYQSGRATIVFFFGFIALAAALLWVCRRSVDCRPLHWTAWAVIAHSFLWLGAVLLSDPQRLILGIPWYLTVALTFGMIVPLLWLLLAGSICAALWRRSWPTSVACGRVLATVLLAFYFPFIWSWHLTILPELIAVNTSASVGLSPLARGFQIIELTK